MRKSPPLALGQVAVLHAIADGNRFGFDIMDATGLTSGTVYPTLDKLESIGYLTSGQASAPPLLRPDHRRRHRSRAGPDPVQEPQARIARRLANQAASGMR